MQRAGLETCMGRGKVHTEIWCGNLKKRDHFEEAGVDGRIILEWIFRKLDGGGGMDWIDMAQNRDG